jgi:hypothetical protein
MDITPFRYARGLKQGHKHVLIFSTRRRSLTQPTDFFSFEVGEYFFGDKYHQELIIVLERK